MKINKKVIKSLIAKNQTIASVESFTGGMFASNIVSVPGSSKVFKGSLIAYSNEIKKQNNIDISNGAVSKKTALSMSQEGKKLFDVDYCISFTGNAGPLAMDNKPVGLVYIAINEDVYEINFNKNKNRNYIRKHSIKFALKKLCELIQ